MTNIIIIGAGPAGLQAAITLAKHNEKVLLLDEYMIAGGRLLGQLYEEPTGEWWNGVEKSNQLWKRAKKLNVDIRLQTSVYDLERKDDAWIVHTNNGSFEASKLLLATGAAEKPFSIPGWTLPGVMSVGAAQVMTNVHRVSPGKKGIIVGINVLSAAIAMELMLAEVNIVGMTLPFKTEVTNKSSSPIDVMDSLLHVSHMAPSKFIQLGSKLMKGQWMRKVGISLYPKNGVKIWDVPILLRKAVVEIIGDEVVKSVKLVTIDRYGNIIDGTEETIDVDFVCIAGGLYPLAELAAIAGCPFYHIDELGGHIPLHNEQMKTPLDGLYVAGNITGIEGAKVAMKQGEIAAFSLLNDLHDGSFSENVEQAIESVKRTRNEAYIQFHPQIDEGRRKLQKYWLNNQEDNEFIS